MLPSSDASAYQLPPDLFAGSGLTLGVLLASGLACAAVLFLTPPLIRKMHAGGMIGHDVNKPSRSVVAELGGISALFAFSVSISLVVGIQKLLGNVEEAPFLAAISVFFMASMIGLIDDISNIKQRLKAIAVAFAALPLALVHIPPALIQLPFGFQLSFAGGLYLVYWLVLVPVGVTGVANAMNMSAGYNGLESGQVAVVSLALLLVGFLRGIPEYALVIFGTLIGCGVGLFAFNRFPAKVFIGDIGTLGLGAAVASGVILGHIEFYGLIAIAPAFYEAGATAFYAVRGENGKRKTACRNPRLLPAGKIAPPEGAERYTLAYYILSKRPMTERSLVRTILALYALCGLVAAGLSVL